MTQIVILEDAPIRLELFKFELTHVDYTITDSVTQFLVDLQGAMEDGKLGLVIMDHDLGFAKDGENRLNFDKDGLCGLDAAKTMPNPDVPILVWSANSEGGKRMCQTLKERGMNPLYLPIYMGTEISSILRKTFPPK